MTMARPTPISIIENYFGRSMDQRDLRFWDVIPDDTWLDFAKTYLSQMKTGFPKGDVADASADGEVRLYFESQLWADFDREMGRRDQATPLLGAGCYGVDGVTVDKAYIDKSLHPLMRHLLMADAVYLRDNFYNCFDALADSVPRAGWRGDPNVAQLVRTSVRLMKAWIPILAGIRELVETGAIVFMPYYATPSFPFANSLPLSDAAKGLVVPLPPGMRPAGESRGFDPKAWGRAPRLPPPGPDREPRVDSTATLQAWMNARLLGLDPVFPNRPAWKWASGIHYAGAPAPDLISDLASIDILPLGREKPVTLADIVKLRRDEEAFHVARRTLAGFKTYLDANATDTATQPAVTALFRGYLHDNLDGGGKSGIMRVLKILDSNLVASTAFSVAMGLAFLTANPLVGALIPALATPKGALYIKGRLDPKARAASCLQALF